MTLDLSRWQIGITTTFRLIWVPPTIGLALILAFTDVFCLQPA